MLKACFCLEAWGYGREINVAVFVWNASFARYFLLFRLVGLLPSQLKFQNVLEEFYQFVVSCQLNFSMAYLTLFGWMMGTTLTVELIVNVKLSNFFAVGIKLNLIVRVFMSNAVPGRKGMGFEG